MELTEEKKPERFPNIHAKPGTHEHDQEGMDTMYMSDGQMAGGGRGTNAWAETSGEGYGGEHSPQGRGVRNSMQMSQTIRAPQPSENTGIRLGNRPSKAQLGGNFPSSAYPRSSSPPPQGDAPPVNEGYMSSLQKVPHLSQPLTP